MHRKFSTSYTPLCMELVLITKKESYRLNVRSSLAVYNAIIAHEERFVKHFFELCLKLIFFAALNAKSTAFFTKVNIFACFFGFFAKILLTFLLYRAKITYEQRRSRQAYCLPRASFLLCGTVQWRGVSERRDLNGQFQKRSSIRAAGTL